MTSKKRKGNDPEALQAERMSIRARAEAGGDSKAPGDNRSSSEAFQAGRRSLAYELVESGGLNPSRLGLEILYLLPDDFIQFYQDLFHQALQVKDDSVMHGRSGGLEKAAGRQGMQLGSKDRGPQAGTSGKRWKNTPMAIGNESALRAKESMDKGLQDLVRDAKRYMAREREARDQAQSAKVGELSGRRQGPGASLKADQTGRANGKGGMRCAGVKCGRFLKEGWSYCPTCGTRTL